MRQFQKNVIKNMVQHNQRLLDYKSPFGVKFWNYILRQTKERDTKKRKKVRKENIQSTIIALREFEEKVKLIFTDENEFFTAKIIKNRMDCNLIKKYSF